MAVPLYGCDMSTRHIVISKLVAGTIVKVADVSVVAYVLIKLNHRVLWQLYVQFRIVSPPDSEVCIRRIACQFVVSNQCAGFNGIAFRVDTLLVEIGIEQFSVTLKSKAFDTYSNNIRTASEKRLPIQAGASREDKCLDVAVAGYCQTTHLQVRQILQP